MKNQMDYKAIEAQLIDNVISVEEFDKLLEYAKVNDGRDGKDQEVKTVDSDGDLVYLTWINDYQMAYVRTARMHERKDSKEPGLFAKLMTKHIDNTVVVRDMYK